MLLLEAHDERRHQPGDAAVIGADGDGAHRIALVRHGGGAALAFGGRLEGFADLRLHHEQHVGGNLGAGAGETRERGCDVEDAAALDVPGHFWLGQGETGGERAAHGEAVLAECRERPRRAAELHRQRFRLDPLQACVGGVRPASQTAAL